MSICPADALKLHEAGEATEAEKVSGEFAVTLLDRGDEINKTTVKGSQFLVHYREFSGAGVGCGGTSHGSS